MAEQLSEGAIMTILTGGEVVAPVLQILGHRKLTGAGHSDRYRILISDGVYLNSYAMLATQLNHMVENNELVEFSIVRLNRHLTSLISNQKNQGQKRVIVLLDITVLKDGKEVGFKIGNPVPCDGPRNDLLNGRLEEQDRPTQPVPPQYRPPAANGIGGNRSQSQVPASPVIGDGVKTHPIIGLTPYQNKWVIKARVTSKSAVRQWSNARGEGKLFSMDLADSSGEIRATAFKDQCDSFYEKIQVGKVYLISRCQLKPANKKFTNINNDYEMTFTHDTQVVECVDEDNSIPKVTFNFVPLQKLADTPVDTIVDIVGVCQSANDVQTLFAKTTNRELKKREITLVDHTFTAVSVTLWGTQAEEFDASTNRVVAIKGGRVSEYLGNKSISLIGSSNMQVNPDIDESHKLQHWFENFCQDKEATFTNISRRQGGDGGSSGKWMLFKEAKDAQLGGGDKPDYLTVLATVLHVRGQNCMYKACPSENCQKKVIDQNNGYYRCEKCNKEFDTYKWRFLFSAQIADWTGSQWVNVFQDQAIELLGVTPDEVAPKYQDEGNLNEVLSTVMFREYLFRLRAKMETYNDETRLRMSVVSAKKPDVTDHCRRLIKDIKEMAGIKTSSDNA
ncbi:replication protein A 70 kDa DNA-binding subunit-like [Macrosteles quadrilineatus]|uniref:replication protein A 70 kDa DNA-binding subunit-like n=1 Tax=Macrosteles quadrilineatus TaxID=74068 RepID=UPI0023E33ABE|nr:replication protein A 70 kDa DNA-binding subunit-like [Macrosteles quadrilineatus]